MVGDKMRNLLYIGIWCLVLCGCAETTAPQRYKQNSYYISGLLHADSTVTKESAIIVGKTTDFNNPNAGGLHIADARVLLKDVTTGDSVRLVYIQGSALDASYQSGYYDSCGVMTILPEHQYQLTVKVMENGQEQVITANTKVPKRVHVLPNAGYVGTLNASLPQIRYEEIDRKYPLELQTTDNNNIDIYLETYCLESYHDAQFIYAHYYGGDEHPTKPKDYEDPVTGAPRKGVLYYEYKPVQTVQGYLITERNYQMYFSFYGRTRVTLYSIDSNYYHYLYSAEPYLHGGVANGIGYFGSVSGDVLYTQIIQ